MAAFSVSALSFFSIYSFLILSFRYSTAQTVPATFIFGDSAIDVGNNNYLPLTVAKSDFPYNGIDFPTKKPTGRFSNGKNAADFLAEKVSLPASPPYLSLSVKKNTDKSSLTGVNFASGGSGILNGTGQSLGIVIPLTVQVENYVTVYEDLVKKLGSEGAQKYLSKSLFFAVTGSNDLLSYYRSSDVHKNTPQQFVDTVISALKIQIQRLHSYGARKFVLPGVPPLGCVPSQRINNEMEECTGDLNDLAVKYNGGLSSMLQQLNSELKDINYTYFDIYGVLQNILQKPAAYGFTEVKAACCGLGKLNAEIPCVPISTYCSNRSNHVFWDIIHPTEATSRILVDIIFDDPSQYTFPMNVRQLVAV